MQEALSEALAAPDTEHERLQEGATASRGTGVVEALRQPGEQHMRRARRGRRNSTPSSRKPHASKDAGAGAGAGENAGSNIPNARDPLTTPDVGKVRRYRRRARPTPASTSTSSSPSSVSPPGTGHRSSLTVLGPVTPQTAAALEAASAERDRAMHEAFEESQRLEGALSSSRSEPSFLSEYSPYERAALNSANDSTSPSESSLGWSPSSAQSRMHLGATSPAPIWTVGSRLKDDNEATDDDGGQMVRQIFGLAGDRRASSRSSDGQATSSFEGAAVHMEVSPAGVSALGRSKGKESKGESESESWAGVGAGAEVSIQTERRYRGEIEGLRTRVMELEGLMGRRLEDKESHRRKLRVVIGQRPSIEVRAKDT